MLDWDDVRVFLAVARAGSQVAAARSLHCSQPSVGRRIAALEAKLGSKLVMSHARGQRLTRAGEELLESALRLEQEVVAVERKIGGRDRGMEGLIRLTTPEWLGVHVVTPILVGFLASRPRLTVELVTEARRLNLLRGEAELALRFAPFEQQEIVQRRVGTIRFGLYATAAYLARAGRPDFADGCRGHAVIAMTEEIAVLDVAWLDEVAGNARVMYRSASRDAQAVAAAADAGLACLPVALASGYPSLELLAVPRPPPDRELWLGMHREAHKTSRVRTLADHLAKTLRLP